MKVAAGGITHCVLPAVAAPSKTLVGKRCTSLRLNFLDTTAPWSSSNSSRALGERRDTHTCSNRFIHPCYIGFVENTSRSKDKENQKLSNLVVVPLLVFRKLWQVSPAAPPPPAPPPVCSLPTSAICWENDSRWRHFPVWTFARQNMFCDI